MIKIKTPRNLEALSFLAVSMPSMPFREDEIVFCEIIDRKIYLNLTSGEVVDYYEP